MPKGSIATLHEEIKTSKLGACFQHSLVFFYLSFFYPVICLTGEANFAVVGV